MSIQIVWLFRAQCSPDGAQGTMWALFRTQGHPDHLSSFGSTLKPFLPYGFPATALISESFRNNHPIETGFHSEWLRYNPKEPRGPIPPKGAEGALRYPWAPWGPLGSPWAPPQGIGTLLKRRKGVSRVWWRSGFTGERILGRRHARQRIWIKHRRAL